ncbi:hypothetical protein [Neotabrizicola sp. VNH66]|uniref:hypothetical protein n=1 Tax=Neotabrizicola sp. VNH66 TaxID=3400918 RepID=UPI003C0CE7AA
MRFVLILALTLLPALARAETALPPELQAVVEKSAKNCASLDGGKLTVTDQAVSRPDLNGDGTPDWILDESGLQCSSDAAYFCGSGGCSSTLLVDGVTTDIFGYGWEVVASRFGPVLLVDVGGADCGQADAAPCVRAMVWFQGRWNTQP